MTTRPDDQVTSAAWTGAWRLPTDKRDHQRAVRKQHRRDRRELARVTDVVVEEIGAWQSRPTDSVYPILHIDAIQTRFRDGGVVAN